ncbi:putative endopeptidase [Vibrio crassostreae]|nr:putative endopeptidase [Vibrio crassostreae]CAK3192976.1 putative endopeptidase [Vibrio crassostreae]
MKIKLLALLSLAATSAFANPAGNDFYNFVNEDWQKSAVIPTGYPSNNSFVEVHLRTQAQLQELVNKIIESDDRKLTNDERNIKTLYMSYTNIKEREALGLAPLISSLESIEAIKDHTGAVRVMTHIGQDSIFKVGVSQDAKAPSHYAAHISQGGLIMDEKNYYTIPEAREAFLAYTTQLFVLSGFEDAKSRAKQVLDFESKLALTHWDGSKMRDVSLAYHPMTVAELNEYTKGYDWETFFTFSGADKGLKGKKAILVTDSAIKDGADLFSKTDIEVIKSYMYAHLLDRSASLLSSKFVGAHFWFHSTVQRGISEQMPLEARALSFTNGYLGMPLGMIYAKEYFPEESKKEIEELVAYISSTFERRFKAAEWMDEQTRNEAIHKLHQVRVKIGYPSREQGISVNLLSTNPLENAHKAEVWLTADSIGKLDESYRGWEWSMTPQTANAYYTANSNEIVFPAAFLQPPFYDKTKDAAYNFGSIGAIIGHELGHAFDDQGSAFDGRGVMRDWWSRTSSEKYKVKTTQLIKQYNQYESAGMKINGLLTLGENIGDLGGLTVALEAYRQYNRETYPNGVAPIVNGLTGEQRFFLAWANVWREKTTDEFTKEMIMTNPHAPSKWRVNGVVRNIDAWYEAFDIGQNDDLYLPPEERVKIW